MFSKNENHNLDQGLLIPSDLPPDFIRAIITLLQYPKHLALALRLLNTGSAILRKSKTPKQDFQLSSSKKSAVVSKPTALPAS